MSDDDLPDTELADTLAAEAPATEAYAWSREGTLPAWEYPRRDWRRFALPGAVALVAMFAAAVAGTILLAPRPSHHEAIRPVQPAPIQAPMPAFPPNARDAFAWLLSERGLSISDATSDQDNRRLG